MRFDEWYLSVRQNAPYIGYYDSFAVIISNMNLLGLELVVLISVLVCFSTDAFFVFIMFVLQSLRMKLEAPVKLFSPLIYLFLVTTGKCPNKIRISFGNFSTYRIRHNITTNT